MDFLIQHASICLGRERFFITVHICLYLYIVLAATLSERRMELCLWHKRRHNDLFEYTWHGTNRLSGQDSFEKKGSSSKDLERCTLCSRLHEKAKV